MKINKATIYYFDPSYNDDGDNEYAKQELKDKLKKADLIIKLYDELEVGAGEWHDEHPLNYTTATKEDYEKFFKHS